MPRKPIAKPQTPPSVRHPRGLPRCQRIRQLPDGAWAQCKREASWQLGARTCGVHGGGWPIRVQRGERKNPVTSSLLFGRRASDRTIALALRDPELYYRVSGEYFDREMRIVVSRSRARLAESSAMIDRVLGKRRRGRPSKAAIEERTAKVWDYMINRARRISRVKFP